MKHVIYIVISIIFVFSSCSGKQQFYAKKAQTNTETTQIKEPETLKDRPACWIENNFCKNDNTQNYIYFKGEGEGSSKDTAEIISKIRSRANLSSYLVVKVKTEIKSKVDCVKKRNNEVCTEAFSQKITNMSLAIMSPSQFIIDGNYFDALNSISYYRIKVSRIEINNILKFAREQIAAESIDD